MAPGEPWLEMPRQESDRSRAAHLIPEQQEAVATLALVAGVSVVRFSGRTPRPIRARYGSGLSLEVVSAKI